MDRARFEQLLGAYGGDLDRWPANERAAAAAFLAAHGAEVADALQQARAVDAALDQTRETPDVELLAARVLRGRPRPVFTVRAALALAACAVFGVMLGYGGGRLAPVADIDDPTFEAAFTAPFADALGEEG